MRSLIENKIVDMLFDYMKKKDINQIELADRLGWSAQDLNDTLKRRKPIGKNRQVHISNKLGFSFELAVNNISPNLKEQQPLYYGLSDEDIEIAGLINKLLTKKQKERLKAFVKSIQNKE